MSRVYLHNKNNYNTLTRLMLYLLIPFAVYGFYKNGIKLFIQDYVGILGMLKPLLIISISALVSLGFSHINKEEYIGSRFLSNILISLIVMPKVNLIIYIVLLLLVNLLSKFCKINIIPIFMILLIGVSYFFKDYSFLNVYESSVEHSFSIFDFLLGKGHGGIGNTSLLLSILSFIVLVFNMCYKKQIPILAFSVFYVLAFVTSFITGHLNQNLLLNNNVIFAFVFISNLSLYTPYSKGATYLYGLSLGLLTYLTSFWDIDFGVYLVVGILSFIYPIFDRFIVGKTDNQLVDIL